MPLDRVWFSGIPVLNRIYNLRVCFLNRVFIPWTSSQVRARVQARARQNIKHVSEHGVKFKALIFEVQSWRGGGGGACLQGVRGHAYWESFKIWNVRDAISRAFRVNLRQKRNEPIEPPPPPPPRSAIVWSAQLCFSNRYLYNFLKSEEAKKEELCRVLEPLLLLDPSSELTQEYTTLKLQLG